MTGFSGILLVLTAGGACEKPLLLYLDHLEWIAVSPLSRVLTF